MHLITSCPCSISLFVLLLLPCHPFELCQPSTPPSASLFSLLCLLFFTLSEEQDLLSLQLWTMNPQRSFLRCTPPSHTTAAPLFLRKVGILINFCRSCSLNLETCSPDSPLSQLLQLSDLERVPDPWSSTFQESQVAAEKKDGCFTQSSWNWKSSIRSRQR